MLLVHVQAVLASQAGALAGQVKQPSHELRQLSGLLAARNAHHRDSSVVVGGEEVVDDGGADRAARAVLRAHVHGETGPGVDLDDRAALRGEHVNPLAFFRALEAEAGALEAKATATAMVVRTRSTVWRSETARTSSRGAVPNTSGKAALGRMPSSRPGKIDAAVFCWIDPPEQPLPIVYLIGP